MLEKVKTIATALWTIPTIIILSVGWLVFPILIFTRWQMLGIVGSIIWYAWAFIGVLSELRRRRIMSSSEM